MSPHLLASFGLVLDIVGAVWVVKGVLAGSDEELARASDSSGTWAGPADVPTPRPALLKILRESRRDARIGAVLLVVGFVAQLTAQWI